MKNSWFLHGFYAGSMNFKLTLHQSKKQSVYGETNKVPELPELDAIAARLTESLAGKTIQEIEVFNHIVIHGMTIDEFTSGIRGENFSNVLIIGRFIIMELTNGLDIALNPMLAGRFRITKPTKQARKSDILAFRMDEFTLWYYDRKQMSRVYLTKHGEYSSLAGFDEQGPSALDPDVTLEVFKKRFKRHRGQIKNVLRNQRFLTGIGNAYADEILLYAGILPFRRKSTLSGEEISRLFESMKKVLTRYRDLLSNRRLVELSREKRDFLMIHGKSGEVCPLCGGRVSEITANRFKTNFCQTCQK
jgi:formamidopyrimidine-DNA glycosylase